MKPYLSVVATSRNDDHGGGMTRRMQLFIAGLAQQAERHRLPLELIMVEWNPPTDRPPLVEALDWPPPSEYFRARIITVPPERHARVPHADKLPLFQMIAKNVGIRRARAPWVLSTNVDLLFSDALMAYLAQRSLQQGFHYRSDRIDISPEVPDGDIAAQLSWAQDHVLRENRAWGLDGAPPPDPNARQRMFEVLNDVEVAAGNLLQRVLPDDRRGPPRRTSRGLLRLAGFAGRTALRPALTLALWAASRTAGRSLLSFPEAVDGLTRYAYEVPQLHFMACGDFMLMHAADWARLHGHPEMAMYSMHLDSLTLLCAEAAGIREVRLPLDMVHFHIEHGYGVSADYRPDLVQALRSYAERGIPTLAWETVFRLYPEIRRTGLTFADEDWGFADEALQDQSL